jgi:hypothetical protein
MLKSFKRAVTTVHVSVAQKDAFDSMSVKMPARLLPIISDLLPKQALIKRLAQARCFPAAK